ncbi:hypothetical protein D9M69_523650 [compost metagenome]
MNRMQVLGTLLLGCTANAWAADGIIRFEGAVVESPCRMERIASSHSTYLLSECAVAPRMTATDPENPHAPVRVSITAPDGSPLRDMQDGMYVQVQGKTSKALLVNLEYL